MQNQIYHIKRPELAAIKKSCETDVTVWVVEIDGVGIQSWEDYCKEIEEKFEFPTSCIDNIDRYLDWIRDLMWLEKDGYILIIKNFGEFMKDDLRMKNEIIADYTETILPWWQEEVEKYVVEGKVKPFNVYLVD